MGNPVGSNRTLWAYGQNSLSSNNYQDDLAILSGSGNRFGYNVDDHGNSLAASSVLQVSGSNLWGSGLVELASDADWFRFTTAGGAVSFTASIGSYVRSIAGTTGPGDGSGATLDLALELRDSSGNLIASADTASLGETVSASGLAAGTYYLVVKSHGGYGDVGTYDITGTATPPGGGGTPPTANAGGGYSVLEGSGGTVSLSGAGSTAGDGGTSGLTYLWDLDGDGVFGETGAGALHGNETGVSPTFVATGLDGPSTYTVSLKVTDSATGLTSSVATANISVTNVAPTVSILGGPVGNSGPEGTAINLTRSVTDPGTADTFIYAWSVTKSGSAYASGTASNFAFTPNDNGTYVVSLVVTDKDGGVGTASTRTFTVTNVAPASSITGAPASSPEGTAINLTGSAVDPGVLDTRTYAWAVTKNGLAYTSGTGAAFGFTPNDNGTYVVTLTATDKDGGTGTASKTITVTNVAPTPAVGGAPPTSPEGTAIGLTASAVDPGVLDSSFTYAWSVTKNGAAYTTGSGSSFTLTPNDNGTYDVTLTATDKDGGIGTTTKTITVTNVAPTPAITGAPTNANEGTVLALTASATDPGTLDTRTYAWAVTRNGQAYSSGTGASFSLTPNDNGTYVVTLTATDKDGGSASTSNTITVANVAPFVTIGGAPTSKPEGSAIALTSTVSDPGTADTRAYAWSVTKNGVAYASGSAASFSFTPNDDGTYVVSLSVTDKDGGAGGDSETIAVTNVAPTLHLGGPAEVVHGASYALALSSTDPGADTISSWTIDWGDGNVETLTGDPTSATHAYAANGTYTISATAQDEDGTFASVDEPHVGVVDVVDGVAPTATFAGVGATTTGATTQTFDVAYLDDLLIDESTFGDGDVLVTGPDGFSQLATFVSFARNVDDGQRTVTYAFTPPGGAWAYTANGTYTFTLRAGEVADAAGNPAPAGTLGSFAAKVPILDLGGYSTGTAAYIGIVGPGYQTTSSDFLSRGDRNDYYRLRIKGTTRIDVKMYGMTDNADVQLLDGYGRVVQTSARAGVRSEFMSRTLTGGTYYLRAYYGGGSFTGYSLRVSIGVGAVAGADAVGNTLGSATYLGIQYPPTIGVYSDALGNGDVNDYYRFRVKQTVSLDASLYGMTDDAQLALLDSLGRTIRISRNTGASDEVVSRTLSPGNYYLRVFSDRPVQTQYTLAFTVNRAASLAAAPRPTAAAVFSSRPLAITGAAKDLLRGDSLAA